MANTPSLVTAPATDWVAELVRIMARLRAPGGCPWDREQSHRTLQKYLVEEACELLDAIEDANDAQMADELGDLLLQVVFHCQIAAEDRRFDLQAVARLLCEKLVRRHPHVFGEAVVHDAAGVVRQWEEIKRGEPAAQQRPSALDGLPRHLPALATAEKLQKRAAKLGFDWPDRQGVVDKLHEEVRELTEALAHGNDEHTADELGDLLFSVVNLCRSLGVDPEDCLRRANRKFRRRFAHVEQCVAASGRGFKDFRLDELDAFWDQAKAAESLAAAGAPGAASPTGFP